jgi:hypothetical protein
MGLMFLVHVRFEDVNIKVKATGDHDIIKLIFLGIRISSCKRDNFADISSHANYRPVSIRVSTCPLH